MCVALVRHFSCSLVNAKPHRWPGNIYLGMLTLLLKCETHFLVAQEWNLKCFVSRLLERKWPGWHRGLFNPEAGRLLNTLWHLPSNTLSELQTLHLAVGHQKIPVCLELHFPCFGVFNYHKGRSHCKNAIAAAPCELRPECFHSKSVTEEAEVSVSLHRYATNTTTFQVGFGRLHLIVWREYSNVDFRLWEEWSGWIVCVNWGWFSSVSIGCWMLEVKPKSHSCNNHVFHANTLFKNRSLETRAFLEHEPLCTAPQ